MKQRVRSGLIGLFFGAFYGGISGAFLFGLLTYFDNSTSFWGSARDWTYLAMLIGLVGGAAVGGILGIVVGAIQADGRSSIIIGTAAGLLIAASQFTGGDSNYIPASTGMFALGTIVYCEILGLVIANAVRKRYQAER